MFNKLKKIYGDLKKFFGTDMEGDKGSDGLAYVVHGTGRDGKGFVLRGKEAEEFMKRQREAKKKDNVEMRTDNRIPLEIMKQLKGDKAKDTKDKGTDGKESIVHGTRIDGTDFALYGKEAEDFIKKVHEEEKQKDKVEICLDNRMPATLKDTLKKSEVKKPVSGRQGSIDTKKMVNLKSSVMTCR